MRSQLLSDSDRNGSDSIAYEAFCLFKAWRARRDSNPQPSDP